MRRNKHFDFYRRYGDTLDYGYGVCNVAWSMDIVSIEGAHYHFWIQRSLSETKRKELLKEAKSAAQRKGDPVAFSWDFIPPELNGRFETGAYDHPTNDFILTAVSTRPCYELIRNYSPAEEVYDEFHNKDFKHLMKMHIDFELAEVYFEEVVRGTVRKRINAV